MTPLKKQTALLGSRAAAAEQGTDNLDTDSIPFELAPVKVLERTAPPPRKREPLLTEEDTVRAFLRGRGAYLLVPGSTLSLKFASPFGRPGPLSRGVPYFLAWCFLRGIEASSQTEQIQAVIKWARSFAEANN